MDIVISNDKTGNNRDLVGKKLMITDEFAEEKCIDRQICSAVLVKESSTSYQLLVAKIEDNYHWIPKSRIVISDVKRSDLFFLEDKVFELYGKINEWRLNQKHAGVLTTIDAAEYSRMTRDSYDNIELVITTGNAAAWPGEIPLSKVLAMYDNYWINSENENTVM